MKPLRGHAVFILLIQLALILCAAFVFRRTRERRLRRAAHDREPLARISNLFLRLLANADVGVAIVIPNVVYLGKDDPGSIAALPRLRGTPFDLGKPGALG